MKTSRKATEKQGISRNFFQGKPRATEGSGSCLPVALQPSTFSLKPVSLHSSTREGSPSAFNLQSIHF
eukprot:309822-Chlamydomonas_euryale.AAC.1